MSKKLSDEQKGQLADQLFEVTRVTAQGIRPFDQVRAALQVIIEGNFPDRTTPLWYTSVEAQIEMVSAFLELHGGQEGFTTTDIPAVPDFTARTTTEVLLLAVYLPDKGRIKGFRRTFDAWWDFLVPPIGLTKDRSNHVNSDSKHLRLLPTVKYVPGIRWVAFDPYTYKRTSPNDALSQAAIVGETLAHTEVLMAAAQFPEWASTWNIGKSPFPNMSTLQLCVDSAWSHVPCLDRWGGYKPLRRLLLRPIDAGSLRATSSSPVVREC